jgi:3-hydroxyacyl-[acyl-carrier-protein] dehydratase
MKLPLPEDILPHRAPMLLLDEVVEVTPERVVATRVFRSDEEFFKGHFPNAPIVPGVYLIEAMAQVMAYGELYQHGPHKMLLTGIKSAKFRKPVLPGQKVTFVLDVLGKKMSIYKAYCVALVDDKKVAEAHLSGTLQPITQD